MTPADAPSVASLLDSVRSDIGLREKATHARLEEWARTYADRGGRAWVRMADEDVAALLAVTFPGPGKPEPEVLYVVVAPSSQGVGIGPKLLAASKRLAERKGWPALTARATPGNCRSRAMLCRAGFRFVKECRDGDVTWRWHRWEAG